MNENRLLHFVIGPQVAVINTNTSTTIGKYPTNAIASHLGMRETFTFPKRSVLDTRCRVQFETFQYNLVLW